MSGRFSGVSRFGARIMPASTRRFVDAQLRGTLVEVEPRRFVDAEDRLAAAVAEVNVVEVDLEDLVLRHARVEQHGQDDLGDLAAPRPLLREEARLDDLLIDGRAARAMPCARMLVKRARAMPIGSMPM